MHPSSLLSYYPTYALLDEIVALNDYKKLNIFVDLKNVLQATYMEHAVVNIVESTKRSQYLDTSVFSSLISFLSFHKMWSIKRGVDVNFFVFFEVGHSYYHTNIDKRYKISRHVGDLFDLSIDDRDLFYNVMNSNYTLIEKACSRMPSVRVIRLKNLEADFIPYYVITRKLIDLDSKHANVIYSNDHDMWQSLRDDVYIFSKQRGNKKLIKQGAVMDRLLKTRNTNIPDEYLPLAMSVIGDTGDDVVGVSGVGSKTFIKIFRELQRSMGSMKEIYENVENGNELFDSSRSKNWNKQMKVVVSAEQDHKTITKNLKLVSFELISRAVDSPKTTEMLERRKFIWKAIQEQKNIASADAMKKALERNGVFLEEASIDFLYI